MHARLQGAWTQIPALAALRDEAEVREFLYDVGERFAENEEALVLHNNVLLVEAFTR